MDAFDDRDHAQPQGEPGSSSDRQAAPAAFTNADERLDFFIRKDGQTFAGTHLIIDLIGAARLDEPGFIETSLIAAAEAAGATVLSANVHVFSPHNGVSGVIVLAESHISIHTWPERAFAAIDVFMCGKAEPMRTLDVIKAAFAPRHVTLQEIKRGLQA
ncbi:MAG: adenosylmethionine decarboxylase [Pseudomonadota bacterium]